MFQIRVTIIYHGTDNNAGDYETEVLHFNSMDAVGRWLSGKDTETFLPMGHEWGMTLAWVNLFEK